MRTIFGDFITLLNIENEMTYSQTIQTENRNTFVILQKY